MIHLLLFFLFFVNKSFTIYSITTSIVVSFLTFCVVQRCYILYYFRLYNLKLYLMKTYVRLSHIRSSLLHLLYKFSIPFVWIFFHSCGVRYMHYMLSYVFSYGVMFLCLLIKDYVGSLYYLHLQSV